MAFLSATPITPPHRPHPPLTRVTPLTPPTPAPSKRRLLTAARASTNLTPVIRTLLTQQKQHPIFSPSLLPPPLSKTLSTLQSLTPPEFHRPAPTNPSTTACLLLADYHPRAIASARRAILLRFPGIDTPGGKLYPAFRAAACWRDLREFTRVVGYYIAAGEGFSERGFGIMRSVYEEMEVPLDAMKVGVACLRDEFVGLCKEEEEGRVVRQGFDTLLGLLEF